MAQEPSVNVQGLMEICHAYFNNCNNPVGHIYMNNINTEVRPKIPDPTPCLFSYTGTVQCYTVAKDGIYKLEVWGAQGGYNSYGGKGGYSTGCISLNRGVILRIYVGGCGLTAVSGDGGYNGGGKGGYYGGSYRNGGGGGATDIRIGGDTFCHRRIVAGGGGGGGHNHNYDLGGYGGGICGGKGCMQNGNETSYATIVATQTSGASFGTGGAGTNTGGGGGGGWYGGGGTCWEGGSGGSGYVYNASTCGNVPSGYIHCSSYYLINSCTVAGNASFPSVSGGTETGHCGCGNAYICFIC